MFFEQLVKAPSGKRVKASVHLARAYGGWVDEPEPKPSSQETQDGLGVEMEPQGWRSAREVVEFLRKRGAKIASLTHGIEGEWAAFSEEEGSPAEDSEAGVDKDDDMVWIPSGQHD